MSDKTPTGMHEILFVCKDWKASWQEEDFEILNSVEGIVFQPHIEDQIDMNMMVKGPEEMRSWLDKNPLLIYDGGSFCEELAWDGKEVLGLKDGEWKSLETILEDEMQY